MPVRTAKPLFVPTHFTGNMTLFAQTTPALTISATNADNKRRTDLPLVLVRRHGHYLRQVPGISVASELLSLMKFIQAIFEVDCQRCHNPPLSLCAER